MERPITLPTIIPVEISNFSRHQMELYAEQAIREDRVVNQMRELTDEEIEAIYEGVSAAFKARSFAPTGQMLIVNDSFFHWFARAILRAAKEVK